MTATISSRCAALCLLASLGGAAQSGPAPAQPALVGTVIWQAAGVRSGSGLTTVVTCSNRGSVAGSLSVQFYSFSGGLACGLSSGAIAPGETRTFAPDAVASLSNVQSCVGAPAIGQGRVTIAASAIQTLKFYCSVLLIDKAAAAPQATRLTLYTGSGALASDVIFADGLDP